MFLVFLPNNTISIDGNVLFFGERRQSVRHKLGEIFTEDNQIINTGYGNGALIQRRGIYKTLNLTSNFFFCCYNENDCLIEIEVHSYNKIKINDIIFDFEDELDTIVSKLSAYSKVTSPSSGEYFFPDIKVVVMNKEKMGGEGTTLGYFYCSSDTTHLE